MKRKNRIRNSRLAAAMAAAGFTNNRLATACSLSHFTVSALLNQRRDPSPKTAKAIARALHCSTFDLFTEVAI